ncbi:MAG: DUF5658 family protein [Thermodesulfobacteriota bacterium]
MEPFLPKEMKDRRKKPTPMFSRYTLNGRRKGFSETSGFPKEGYVDRYTPGMLFFLVLLGGLNCLDSLFTMKILHHGGRELNPIMDALISLVGEKFWIWKFVLVSICSVIICLHSHYKPVKVAIVLLCTLYVVLIGYQLIGLNLLGI